MKNIFSALVSLTLLGSLLVGCGNAVESASVKATASDACVDGQAGDHEYVFSAGSAQIARVVRSMREDGSETLSGVSKVSRGTLKEYAELAADGHLVYADVSFVAENGAERRMVVDAARGSFYVQDARGAAWYRSPKDAPWVLAGLTDDDSAFTLGRAPVSAWIAARAAKIAPNLRIVDAKLRQGIVATADQFVVEGDAGERFVVTGSSVVAINDEFVTSLGEDTSANPTRMTMASLRPRRTAQR
jgi:hypothetical protein